MTIKEGYTLARYFAEKIKHELGQNMTINRLNRIIRLLNLIVMILSTITIFKMKN